MACAAGCRPGLRAPREGCCRGAGVAASVFPRQAASTRRDGVLDNVTTGTKQNSQDSISLRGQLLFQPTDQLRVRLFADYADLTPECCTQVYVTAGQTLKPAAQQFAENSPWPDPTTAATHVYCEA